MRDRRPERRVELQRLNPKLTGREVVERLLRGVWVVEVTDAGVVTSHDEVGAAVVLANERVEDRFA